MCAVVANTAAAINTGGSCGRSSKQAFAVGQLSMLESHAGRQPSAHFGSMPASRQRPQAKLQGWSGARRVAWEAAAMHHSALSDC